MDNAEYVGLSVPQAAPEIHLVSSTPDSLKISWTPLTRKQANGKIMEYKVQWRLEGTPSNNVQHVDGSILKYDITGNMLPFSGSRSSLKQCNY